METDLTKAIKCACHGYKPKMPTTMRTIRYADEVWTRNGIVDVIRFEDYVVSRHEECRAIEYEHYDFKEHELLKRFVPHLGRCKIEGETFPNEHCRGCFALSRDVSELSICTTAFEVKVTKSDFKSKNGHNIDNIEQPIANENYYAVPKDLVKDIEDLIPKHVGILAYQNSGQLRKVKDAAWLNVPQEDVLVEMYNALKKWCDGAQKCIGQ